ncbi:MAG: alpha/beta hydrolase-fold protein [Mycobacteriaceae bacterium]|uniref:alpha/beta hydrolase-fold protein n=1 Tax=Corynebacterium sp. TaxID=1720 RepID=UPI003F9B9C00
MRIAANTRYGKSPVNRTSRRIGAAVLAVPLSIALAMPLTTPAVAQVPSPGSGTSYLEPDEIPERVPQDVTGQDLPGLPDGVDVDRVEWISDRWANVYINTPSMPEEPVMVQILLARDWYSQPDRDFPSIWSLDGLRARDDESGWTLMTNIQQFYADKNVNVVMPVGGNSSFYTDWDEQPEDGKTYKWETFLTQELPAVLREGWRTTEQRAITGISMGGTAAVNLAQHNPGLFQFVGSYSGYLDTTSTGIPQAINYATNEGAGYDAQKMWGPYGGPRWDENDPKQHADKLKDTTVYASAGNGNAGPYDEVGDIPGFPANPAAFGLEAMSRMTTQTFVNAAKEEGVDVIAKYRPSGTHDWPYWQYEMTQSWPYIAQTFGLSEEDRGVDCKAVGKIAEAEKRQRSHDLGTCTTDEYDGADGGKVQDFSDGRVYWKKDEDKAFAAWGRIGARYSEMGGSNSWLGYPTGEEVKIKGGFLQNFEEGAIYWTPELGAVPVKKDVIDAWGKSDWETGPYGFPTAPAEQVDGGGAIQEFQNGVAVRDKDGKVHMVQGKIAEKYLEAGGPQDSGVGFPTSDEIGIRGGAFSQFEDGNIYWSASAGANIIKKGKIFDAWGEDNHEQGRFGFPTSDQESIPSGGERVEFEHGEIREVNGNIEKDPR